MQYKSGGPSRAQDHHIIFRHTFLIRLVYDYRVMKLSSLRSLFSVPWQRTLYIMFFAQMMTAVGFSSINPFLPLYVKDLGSSTDLSIELLAGLVYSAQAFTMMLASPIWGSIADRYGRKLMVQRSMFGGSVIVFIMAFSSTAEQLIILRAIQGLITGTVAASSALIASIAPRDRTGYAMGLLQVGLGAGIALGPLMGGAVADTFGYSYAFYVTAALLLISGMIVLFGVREEFAPGEASKKKDNRLMKQWGQIITMPGMGMAYGMRFMAQLGRMMVIPVLALYIETLLKDTSTVNTFTGLVIGAGSIMMTLSGIYLGRLGDRIGHRPIVIISCLFAGLLYMPQSVATQGWHMLVLYALVGIGIGGIIPSLSALLTNYSNRGDEGAVFGLDNSIRAGARSIAPMIGSTVGLWFGLPNTFIASGLIFLVTGVLAVWFLPKPESASKRQDSLAKSQY
jgi:DHA1 family multidrug resistance protein-like MFS transporter